MLFEDSGPHEGEAFIESEFFPHFESLFTAKSSALYETMDSTVRMTVSISFVIKSVSYVSPINSFTEI